MSDEPTLDPPQDDPPAPKRSEDGCWQLLKAMDQAMKLEGISEVSREHVLNRLIYGDPHPGARRRIETEQTINVVISNPQPSGANILRLLQNEIRLQGNQLH